MANWIRNCALVLLVVLGLLTGMAWCRSATPAPTASKSTVFSGSVSRKVTKVTAAPIVATQHKATQKHLPLAPAASKQLFVLGSAKETSPPDFIRLVVMRLIYGLASTMGLEERLEGVLNGVFVPPNADEGIFSFGGGYDDGDDGGLDMLFDDF